MHPAYSVILFTTASGAGYGLLFGLALFTLVGGLPEDPAFWLGGAGLAFAMVTFGLLASTAHLGHPERAWRALSQWRSSWLSREGVAAVLSYPVAGLFALDRLFAAPGGDLDGTAGRQNAITIGGLPFTPSQAGRYPGALDFSSYTPYAGLGVQSTFWSGRLEFALDFGLQYQGNSGAELGSEGSPSSASAAAGERDAEETAEQLDLLGFSPRAGLSVKLRF